MSSRRSNEERARWRNKCRKALSKQIGKTWCRWGRPKFTENSKEDRLGLLVEPSQVRLVPGPNDPYGWRYPPHLRRLFKRNMSDQTVGVYKALCREVEVKKPIRAAARHASAELREWEISDSEVDARVRISASRCLTYAKLSLYRTLFRPSQMLEYVGADG